MAVARQRIVIVELAETAAEGDVLLARDLLVAEQQDALQRSLLGHSLV